MLEAVIFDWDGVISDSLRTQEKCYKGLCDLHNKEYPYKSLEELRENYTEPFTVMYDSFGFNWERDKNWLVESYVKLYLSIETKPFGEAPEFLENISKLTIIGVATSQKASVVFNIIKKYNLNVLDENNVFTFDENKHEPKPAPDILLEALENLNLNPANTLYVGDMPSDIITARNAGTQVCAVTWGYASRKKLLAEYPDFIIDSFSDLLNLVKYLNHSK